MIHPCHPRLREDDRRESVFLWGGIIPIRKMADLYWSFKILQALPGFFTRGPCRKRELSLYINSLPFWVPGEEPGRRWRQPRVNHFAFWYYSLILFQAIEFHTPQTLNLLFYRNRFCQQKPDARRCM